MPLAIMCEPNLIVYFILLSALNLFDYKKVSLNKTALVLISIFICLFLKF